ncbi:nucleoside/nucleotide kinase family protein [Nocardia puris]|uniref:nucleoside/nucleotide kinase family protein n=1 Tax=Nocardia puris TaxID=208602 RepID=UPI002B4B6067|nr:nucleoside/nucleotide kinase family protein [Nocardia puris]
MVEGVSIGVLVRRVVERADAVLGRRYVLGIAGPPGAGKSTLAQRLCAGLGGSVAGIAPMDGYHLSNAVLRAAGMVERKGEPDTFDAGGFVVNLRRLRGTPLGEPVPWPTFDRALDEPTPGGVVFRAERVAVVEGNYLLLEDGPWAAVRAELDECWYLDADRDHLERRLLDRHLLGGRTPDAARAKVADSDLRNADLVALTRSRADLILRADDVGYVVGG